MIKKNTKHNRKNIAKEDRETITKGKIDSAEFDAWLSHHAEIVGTHIKATEVADYNPTRDELIQLVKYWTEVLLEVRYFQQFRTGMHEGNNWTLNYEAKSRISRITKLIGEKTVNQVIDEVYTKSGKTQDKKRWKSSLFGTEKDKEAAYLAFHNRASWKKGWSSYKKRPSLTLVKGSRSEEQD